MTWRNPVKRCSDRPSARLATLPTLECEWDRDDEAARLGISRTAILEKEVRAHEKMRRTIRGEFYHFDDIEPWSDPVDGA